MKFKIAIYFVLCNNLKVQYMIVSIFLLCIGCFFTDVLQLLKKGHKFTKTLEYYKNTNFRHWYLFVVHSLNPGVLEELLYSVGRRAWPSGRALDL